MRYCVILSPGGTDEPSGRIGLMVPTPTGRVRARRKRERVGAAVCDARPCRRELRVNYLCTGTLMRVR